MRFPSFQGPFGQIRFPIGLRTGLVLGVIALGIAGCSTTPSAPPEPPAPPVMPTLPPSFPPQDLVGSWGLAAYHRDEDRVRTESAAAGQCRQPYVITAGPTGGIMMHLADQSTPTELRVKGAPGGKNFIGPAEDPPGSQQDREVLQFDGRILVLRWMDSEVQGRYGTMVYVRCGAEGGKKKPAAKPRPKPAAKPKPAPAAR
jgi:hypothetical protein